MSFQYVAKLPTPEEIREQFPLPAHLVELKRERDIEIRDVITGKSKKFIVIIGPCSADNEEAVCDYVNRLAKVSEKSIDKTGRLLAKVYERAIQLCKQRALEKNTKP